MKVLILCIALVLAVVEVKSDVKEDIQKAEKACREETKVTEEDWQNVMKTGLKEEPKEPIKCLIKCVFEKQGQWKNGAFDENAAKKNLQGMPVFKDRPEVLEKTLNDCKIKKGANECDTTYLILKCFLEHKSAL